MNINMPTDTQFNKHYQKRLKCLRLNGFRPKTVDACSRAIRRIGKRFDFRIENLSSDQLPDYFNELPNSSFNACQPLIHKEEKIKTGTSIHSGAFLIDLFRFF